MTTVTISPIASVAQSTAFQVHGSVTPAPVALSFSDDSGAGANGAAGSAYPAAAAFSFWHPGIAAAGTHTITVTAPDGTTATATVSVTGTVPHITPGVGSLSFNGHVYTIDTAEDALQDGAAMAGGAHTEAMALGSAQTVLYRQDAGTQQWFTWDATNGVWNGPVAAPTP